LRKIEIKIRANIERRNKTKREISKNEATKMPPIKER
jgi:hypothetical protein